MRHKISHRKLNRTSAHRRALFRNMSVSIVLHEGIITTVQKAKEIRPIVEKLVTKAREDSVHSRRLAHHYLKDREAVTKLFSTIAPRYTERPGGYLRITRIGNRVGDCAEMAKIEFV